MYGMDVILPTNSISKPFSNLEAINNKEEMYWLLTFPLI